MAFQQIPLTNEPNQNFQITLDVNDENKNFGFNVVWNEIAGYWVITITDMTIGEIIIDSLPLVGGRDYTSNILRKYGYLKIGVALFVPSVEKPDRDYPDKDSLGEDYVLIWDDNI